MEIAPEWYQQMIKIGGDGGGREQVKTWASSSSWRACIEVFFVEGKVIGGW